MSESVVRSSHMQSESQELISLDNCEVCWSERAKYVCRLCCRVVCSKHYVAERGMCAICFKNLCEICRKIVAVDSCIVCSKLVCRSCSRELQPGIRICERCLTHIHEYVKQDVRLSYIKRYLEKSTSL